MDKNTLIINQEHFVEQIQSVAKIINQEEGAIWDGVGDIDAYINSSPKVAWILKEPYDEDIDENGWSHFEYLNGLSVNDINTKLTWKRVNSVMYSLRHNTYFDESIIISKNYLSEIAWLNVSKLSGESTSNKGLYKKHLKEWLPILKEQVKAYNPDIIIFGNTFDLCKDALFGNGYNLIDRSNKFIHVYSSNNRLLLYAYHPGWWGISDSDYINSIVDSVRSFYKRVHS